MTARGNPGMPFYFLFAEKNGQYQLSGEGTGRPEFTRKAYDDLRRLEPAGHPGAGQGDAEDGAAPQSVNGAVKGA